MNKLKPLPEIEKLSGIGRPPTVWTCGRRYQVRAGEFGRMSASGPRRKTMLGAIVAWNKQVRIWNKQP